MENIELILLESMCAVREYENNNEAHLRGVDLFQQTLFPRATEVESSAGSNNSSGMLKEHIVHQNHLRADSVTTSIDHDPEVTFTSLCSSSLIPSEDFYQAEEQSGIKSDQSKLEDDKSVGFTSSSKTEDDGKGASSSLALDTSVMDSPTKQMMDRDEDYEPYRIPSSVFDRSDSMAPAEWSIASNESLFSLHGGVSFGRDQIVLLREESHKSRTEELTKLDELTSNPPSASDEAGDGEAVDEEREVEEKELVIDQAKEDGAKAHSSEEELAKPPTAVMGSSVSCRSDASDGSTFSFAFPILAPGRAQNTSTKGGASSPQKSHSREPHSQPQPDNYISTPPQPPSARKRSCFSCFSICSLPSCCSCSSCCCCCPCSSCWPFKS